MTNTRLHQRSSIGISVLDDARVGPQGNRI